MHGMIVLHDYSMNARPPSVDGWLERFGLDHSAGHATLISLRYFRLASIRSTIQAKVSMKSAKMPSEYLPI